MSVIQTAEPVAKYPEAGATDAEILNSLDVTLPATAVSPAYGIAMTLLAAWLALIPLVYLAILAFLAYLVVWHLAQTVITFSDGPFFIFHLPMAFLGGLLLLFLIKPVFFRRRVKEKQIVTLSEADEPLLFAYVQKLCKASGCKPPASIEVDCDANAHARLRRGLLSVFGGDLVLRIGLPLAADLSLRQFTGVLAHEFGHFNQRRGMSGSYLVRRLTLFFAQIVFQRDKLDEYLVKHRLANNGLRQLFYWLMIGPIEAARGVLWLMLMIGELLTCGVLRRMEYDADRQEALIAGTTDFIQTSHSLAFLALAARMARSDLAETWEDGRVADDLPRLIVANGRYLAETRRELLQRIEREKTNWLDTHPSHGDRIRYVESLGCDGLLRSHGPAHRLFANFDNLCRRATQAFYADVVGDKLKEAKLVSTAEFTAERLAQRKAYRSLNRFLRGHVIPLQPILPYADADHPMENPTEGIGGLQSARQAMLKAADDLKSGTKTYQNDAQVIAAARAQMALCHMFSRTPAVVRVQSRASRTLRKTEPVHSATREKYEPFAMAARARLTAALRLLQSDLATPRAGGGEDYVSTCRARAAYLVGVCREVEPFVQSMSRLSQLAVSIRVMAPAHNPRMPHQTLVRRILSETKEAADILRELSKGLMNIPYPYQTGSEVRLIGTVFVPKFPEERNPVDTHACAVTALNAYSLLVVRVLAELAQYADAAEQVAGLEPLGEPTEFEDDKSAGQNRGTWKYWLSYGARASAGVGMFAMLVWMSIHPPVLPAMPWDNGYAPGGYQPNSFHVPFAPPPRSPSAWTPVNPANPMNPMHPNPYGPGGMPGQPGFPGAPEPRHPGMMPRHPGDPMPGGATPGMPGQPGQPVRPWYQPYQPQPPKPYQPGQPYQPQPYQPPSPWGGGGGGGGRPGGGGFGGRGFGGGGGGGGGGHR